MYLWKSKEWGLKEFGSMKLVRALNRRNCWFLLVATLVFFGSMNSFGSTAYGSTLDYIKVGLKYGNSSVVQGILSAEGGLVLGSFSQGGFSDVAPLNVKRLSFNNDEGNIQLFDVDGKMLLESLGENQVILSADYQGGGTVKYDEKPYRGGILLKQNSEKIMVINCLDLEHYVYGVLAAEIGASSHLEAIKAQAVAARSYAGANVGAHNSSGFNLCATTHCQVYNGYSGEYANTNKGADETRGLMIYSEGKPVTAYYAKNSGGHTQNAEDVWYASLPYLRGVADSYAPEYLWEAKITFEELQKKLEAAGHTPGEIQQVAITKRSAAGAVYTLEIKGKENTVTLNKDGVRTTLGGTSVKSLMFSFVDSSNISGVGGTSGGGNSGSGNSSSNQDFAYVVSSNGVKEKVSSDTLYISNGSAKIKWQEVFTGNVDSGNTSTIEKVTSGILYLKGKGYGHGVGMQQDGAIAMAKQGFTYDQILKFYYTNIEIK